MKISSWIDCLFLFLVSQTATDMAKALDGCRTAFGACRKAEDKIAGVIHSCQANVAALLSKAKSLDVNKAAVTKAQEKVKTLAAAAKSVTRYGRSLSDCPAVVRACNSLVLTVKQEWLRMKGVRLMISKISKFTIGIIIISIRTIIPIGPNL